MADDDALFKLPTSLRKCTYTCSLLLSAHNVADRLPTVSASQALQEIKIQAKKSISTGLKSLDQLFVPQHAQQSSLACGGLPLGRLTEVYGPPGIGKTTFWFAPQLCMGNESETESSSEQHASVCFGPPIGH